MPEEERLREVAHAWGQNTTACQVEFTKAETSGRVTVQIWGYPTLRMPRVTKGAFLMEIEAGIQRTIPGIILVEKPLGDANKLRLFRGVKPL